MLLIFDGDVKNISEKDQDFGPLDIGISDQRATLAAAGTGNIPFTMGSKSGWDKLRNETRVVPRGESRPYMYVFSVPKDTSSWELTYKGRHVSDLR